MVSFFYQLKFAIYCRSRATSRTSRISGFVDPLKGQRRCIVQTLLTITAMQVDAPMVTRVSNGLSFSKIKSPSRCLPPAVAHLALTLQSVTRHLKFLTLDRSLDLGCNRNSRLPSDFKLWQYLWVYAFFIFNIIDSLSESSRNSSNLYR